MANSITQQRGRRANRVRSRISGTADKPRLSVHVSHLHVSAQLIDDTKGQTLAYVTTVGRKDLPKGLTEKSAWVGAQIAKKAKQTEVKRVVFDRGNKLYHGRVKRLAEAAREEGMKF